MLKETTQSNSSVGNFLSIIGGKFRKTVEENTPGAIRRDWEVAGKTGTKWEKEYASLSGKIKSVNFTDGEYGKNLSVWIEDGGTVDCVTVGVIGAYGEDLLKKLPAINLKETVELTPFDFMPENGKRRIKGISIKQGDVKVKSFYRDAEGKPINGIPAPEGDTSDYDEEEMKLHWKSYFAKVRKFMIKNVDEKIIPNLEPAPTFEKKEDKKETTSYGNEIDEF